jgi:undecaprenyl pyrophosphate synthase
MYAFSSYNWTRPRAALLRSIGETEGTAQDGARLHLRLAVDYSGRHYISSGEVGPDVDLLVRPGGEQRLWPDYISAGHGLVPRTQPEIRRFGTI